MANPQLASSQDQPVHVTLGVLEAGGEVGQTLISQPLSAPLLKAPSAAAVGSAVVFALTEAWKLYDASSKLPPTTAKPQHSAVILKGTVASDYSDAQSWQSKWQTVTLKNSVDVTTTSLDFRIRASTMAQPPQRTPALRPGVYIPNITVDINNFFVNILQSVDIDVSLTNWECRPPKTGGNGCVAYVELTVTISSHLLQTWQQSFTYSIRADETEATLLK